MAILFWLGSTIGNVDISSYVNYKSVNITDSIQIKGDTLSFEMTIINRATRAPGAGNTVYIYDDIAGEYEFAGLIETVREELLNPITFKYSCDAIDWIKVFDRHLVKQKFKGDTVVEIISTILAKYANTGYDNWFPFTYKAGGAVDNIQVNEALDFDFKEPSACLDELAEKVGAQWYIGFDRVLHFDWPSGLRVPSPLTEDILDLDSDISSYGDMVLTESISNIKNVIYITDAKVKGDVTTQQRFDGPGKSKQYYHIGFPLFLSGLISDWSSYILAKITDQTTNEVLIRSLTDVRSDSGSQDNETSTTIYINADTNSVRLPDKYLLGASERLIITAYKAEDTPSPFSSPASIALIRKRENMGSDGWYEYKKTEPNLWDSTGGQNQNYSAQLIIRRYAFPLITGEFYSYLTGWRAGTSFYLVSYLRMNGRFKIPTTVFVKSVSKTIEIYGSSIATSRIKSKITFSNNEWEGG